MKLLIYVGLTIGGIIGGWIGASLDHGNYFGAWSILLGGVGSLLGIWVAFKVGKNYLGQ